MAPESSRARAEPRTGAWAVALAGAVALAVAMGIGRFAFTPLLPMMLHDGVVDLAGASWLASANYGGYLCGALFCTFQPWLWARGRGLPAIDAAWLVRTGLIATALLTLGMVLPWPPLWPVLRAVAGVASALVFVHTSGWCMAHLARRDAGTLGGVIYTGPGAGIVVSGLFASAMVQSHWRAASAWAVLAVLAFGLTAIVWRVFRDDASGAAAALSTVTPETVAKRADVFPQTPVAPVPHLARAAPHGQAEVACLAIAYGLAGLGYIVTATFLPVIARQTLPGSAWLDLFWPIFGAGVMIGALLATRLRPTLDMRALLLAAYLLQAAGIGVGLLLDSLAGFAFGSLLLGLPFTAITFFAMQEVRRLRPTLVASTMGLLTALYGIGQIAGPPLVAGLLAHTASPERGFALALQVAMAALLAGAALWGSMLRVWPMRTD